MNLRWITLFATIAEEGSFTRAATKLNIAQPWLSAQLRKLEYELGVQLLIRENVGVRVSEAGELLLPHARQIAESARLFRETARSLSQSRSQMVKLGCYVPIIDVPALKATTLDFANRYFNFELDTEMNYPADLVKSLDEWSLDLALLPREWAESAPEMDALSFGSPGIYVLVPAKKARKLEDIRGATVGVPPKEWGNALDSSLRERFKAEGIATSEVPEFDRRAIEHSVTSRGAMVAMALDEKALAALDPHVRAIPVDGLGVEHVLCRVRGRELGRAAERFWTMCERMLIESGSGDGAAP
ncbi:LysR family transcriptional regulator [Croceicoccus sp. BE223]|uniref:LysR family transcriptional regulator n=1 Tax=Croceicoccus sp. BE223 TaxID=2817716 RepID=UPI002861051D|nr:LysR family transcriptional regulator [Croceicoccus sp. BE223]MDR7103697.1 DNA-binding transcriptional LysR family regulator [Croceicoccus sp. BE223]